MVDEHEHEHRLSYHCHKGITGEYIGQIVEIPEVIVHASTREKIKQVLLEALSAYFDAFPKEHERITQQKGIERATIEELIVTE